MTIVPVPPSASPAREHTISKPVTVPYVGALIFQKPTTLEIVAAGKRARELRGDLTPDEMDPERSALVNMILELELGIHQAPEGWSPTTCDETDDLIAVWEAYRTWRASFRPKVAPPQEDPGAAVQQDGGLLVPDALSAAANGPALPGDQP